MSYILDALKKAEAERSTGAASNPHLPPSTAAPAASGLRHSSKPWMVATVPAVVLAAALALVLAGLAWMRSPPSAPAAPVRLAQAAPSPAAPKMARQPAAEAVPDEPANPVEAATEVPPAKAKAAKTAAAKKAPPPPAAAPAPVLALRDLPETIQRQIPPLKVGGYIYSSNKAERSVLINDRLLAEGDEAAPGLVLERMQPDGMIMRYQGYQYRMRY
ncbi:MAG TPA: general secretion pathway protein GspB [Burkholderiaceae bacterium]|nr:general secretion pathway protein GspB [Burkholderiaceae bacterium]